MDPVSPPEPADARFCSPDESGASPSPPVCSPLEAPADQAACFDNGFDHALSAAPVATGADQVHQAVTTARLAAFNALSGHDWADRAARRALTDLKPTPPLEGQPTATAEYASHIPLSSPAQVYGRIVAHPEAVFGAAGITLRGADGPLRDGQRLMLEEPAQFPRPPVWAPVEVRLDPLRKTLRITTLDGHPLRGRNDFFFLPDGRGGTHVRQRSEFQGSAWLTTEMGRPMGAMERQQDIWRRVHGELAAPWRCRE